MDENIQASKVEELDLTLVMPRSSVVDTAKKNLDKDAASRPLIAATFAKLPTLVLIDGTNFYETIQALDLKVNFRHLHYYLAKQTDLIRLKYYTALLPDDKERDKSLASFLRMLMMHGYVIETSVGKKDGGTVRSSIKVDLATDMVEAAGTMTMLRHVVLFSGDGDFIKPVQSVQRRGITVTIVSNSRAYGDNRATSMNLLRIADSFVELPELLVMAEAIL